MNRHCLACHKPAQLTLNGEPYCLLHGPIHMVIDLPDTEYKVIPQTASLVLSRTENT